MNHRKLAIGMLALALCVMALPTMAQMTSTGIDCSQISAMHLLQQDNMRASKTLIECGIVKGGGSQSNREIEESYPQPPNVLVSNRTCSSQTSCTKSESMVWSSPDGQTLVVNYNDDYFGNGSDYSGTSYSTDGGATFTEIAPPPFASGHGTNYGDPIVVFNKKLNMWFAGDIVTGCGGFGIGLWTSPDGINWAAGGCAHNGNNDDRESFWVDNDPTSAGYGRMYVTLNNFNVNGGALFVSYSDDGTSWTQAQLSSGFIRDVQVTGAQISPTTVKSSLNGYNTVFVASMDEGSGGLSTRQNVIWRSTNGGASWTSFTTGPRFSPPGDGTCGYFAKMNPIIRHMGWGQPAVGPNNVVHYAYAGHGQGSDNGDIFYVRSTDNGATWSAPIVLNTDAPGILYHTQWMPSVSVNPAGKLTVSWYDRRQASTACNSYTDVGCSYNRYARQSADNGNTWQASDFVVSSSLSPQPAQLDGNIQSCYAGDYDNNNAQGGTAYITWTDGRRSVNNVAVQDVNFAAVAEQ
jgi:hypothetical protein